jgi:heat-inducible transcriptional repressor
MKNKTEIRQSKLLMHLIDEYIETNEPVSSGLLCKKYLSYVSPATIRIDLHKMEGKNLIFQPHTSAGRIPTLNGFKKYFEIIEKNIEKNNYKQVDTLQKILIANYKDIPLALHYIKQLLAKETEQLSFVAEPEIANGYLKNFSAFKIDDNKILFVVSLDSGIDKTVIIKCESNISPNQLKALVRYINDELYGARIFDIQNKYLRELNSKMNSDNGLMISFMEEIKKALSEISNYFIFFDGNINFLEQPEFDSKKEIISFLGLMQRQDLIFSKMQEKAKEDKPYYIISGDEFGQPKWSKLVIVFSKYHLFDIPGYLGIVSPIRMNYRKTIPIIKDMAKAITETTKKGMVIQYEK